MSVVGAGSESRSVLSSGRMSALSWDPLSRRGRADRSRVVARRRWLQKRQCCVRIGRRGVGSVIVGWVVCPW